MEAVEEAKEKLPQLAAVSGGNVNGGQQKAAVVGYDPTDIGLVEVEVEAFAGGEPGAASVRQVATSAGGQQMSGGTTLSGG